MTTVRQYTQRMRAAHVVIGQKMGTDLTGGPKSLRVAIGAIFVVLAVVVKTIVDKGLITDQDLVDQLNALAADTYDDEPN